MKRANKKSEKIKKRDDAAEEQEQQEGIALAHFDNNSTHCMDIALRRNRHAGSWNKDDFASWEQSPLRDDQLKLLEYGEVSTINVFCMGDAGNNRAAR